MIGSLNWTPLQNKHNEPYIWYNKYRADGSFYKMNPVHLLFMLNIINLISGITLTVLMVASLNWTLCISFYFEHNLPDIWYNINRVDGCFLELNPIHLLFFIPNIFIKNLEINILNDMPSISLKVLLITYCMLEKITKI